MDDDTKPAPEEADEVDDREGRAFLEPGLESTEARVPMLSDELGRVRRLIERNGWDEPEGCHIVFSRGLVALERESGEASALEGKRLIDMRTPEEREAFLLARLSDLESKYSVMKFSAFNALRDNETLRMNVTGLKTEYKALSTMNKYLREREDELRARNGELEQIVADRASAADPSAAVARKSRWDRIRDLIRVIFE